jgi:hypothetical protein
LFRRLGECRAVFGFEEGGAGYEGVGSGGAAERTGSEVHAAVYFQAEFEFAFSAPGVDFLELGHHVFAETLATESGLHGHHEHKIDLIKERLNG